MKRRSPVEAQQGLHHLPCNAIDVNSNSMLPMQAYGVFPTAASSKEQSGVSTASF